MSLDRELVIRALPSYEVGREIGRGGWGVVLSATHRGLGRRVAIKQLPRAFGADPAVRARFQAEARLVASLNHPHIVPIFDFVEHDGLCLIVMELLTGGTLWDRFLGAGVPLDEGCAHILAACAALQHAHDHEILHRDIKPENFLFSDAGTIKLGDFGIAKVIGQSAMSMTVAGSVMGTPAYMAPEQALGQKLGPTTDVYSLGVMLYELACGELPFPEGEDPLRQLNARIDGDPRPLSQVRPDIHPALAEITMRAIARQPDDRPATAHDLGVALAEAATKAFGAGWLRRTRLEIMSASEMIAITERSFDGGLPVMRPSRLTRAATVHARIGDVVPSRPSQDPVGDVAPALPSPSNPPHPPKATLAPGWAAAAATPPAPSAPAPPAPPAAPPLPPPRPTPTPTPTPTPASAPAPAPPPPPPSLPSPPSAPAPRPAPPSPPAMTPPPFAPAISGPPAHAGYATPGTGSGYPGAPTGTHPMYAPGPQQPAPPSRGRGRLALLVGVILLVAGLAVVGVVVATQGTNTAAPGPSSTSSTVSTSRPGETTTTAKPLDPPVISRVATVSPRQLDITWTDPVSSTPSDHVLIAYSASGKEENPVTANPQRLDLPAGVPYCYLIADAGNHARRSEARCVNGGNAATLVT